MFLVDTDVFLQAAIKELPHHQQMRALVEKWRRQSLSWFSTWSIFYEFLRVSTHGNVFEKPLTSQQAWDFLKVVVQSSGFSLLIETSEHENVMETVLKQNLQMSGNIWHDVHTMCLMMEHGIRDIYTFDTDFHRFLSIQTLNPLFN